MVASVGVIRSTVTRLGSAFERPKPQLPSHAPASTARLGSRPGSGATILKPFGGFGAAVVHGAGCGPPVPDAVLRGVTESSGAGGVSPDGATVVGGSVGASV